MASVHRQKGKPHYFAAYSTWDPATQRWQRRFKSTKTTNKKQAEEVARAWEQAAKTARNGLLTPEAAREVIARGVSDVFLASNAEDMPRATVGDWIVRWLQAKELENGEATADRYRGIVERFKTSLGAKAKRDLAALTPADVQKFRDAEARERSRGTANLSLKVLRACCSAAEREGLLTSNPARKVPIIKARADEKQRRAFTLAEIKRALEVCEGTEFYGLVLTSIYTGQRLGDIARMTWQQVDLEKGIVRFVQRKTGHRLELPLAVPLRDYLLTLPASDDPTAPIFPKAAHTARERVNTLSRQFYDEVLVPAGLAELREHRATKDGRSAGRDIAELSFHSLRHSAVSLLKASGATDAMAKAIAGHESTAVSAHYTHLSADDLRATVEKLPDVTKTGKQATK
jgi:integrase